ncbi:MAG: hypothetical protein HY550_12225 [Elusimicrobia bacterium]|nr:hypothetical protein [Elusimicrobiota bacterium]
MKKMIIGVVVLLAAALIGLKYFANKQPIVAPAPGMPAEPQGVALPAGSASPLSPAAMLASTPAQASGSYELLALPAAALEMKGACEEGSPKLIMENHGKTWGYFTGRRNAFDPPKTQELYNFLWSYQACVAASRRDSTACSELPGDVVKDSVRFGVPMSERGSPMSPMDVCRNRNVEFFFKAYVAGKAKEEMNCTDYLSDWEAANMNKISPPEFCSAAAQGPEKLLAYGRSKMPEMFPMAEKAMAFSKKACGSSSECLSNYDLWEGLSTGDPARCPAAFRASCAALLQKSPAPCSVILLDMSKKYCASFKALAKHSGGFAGSTPEEVKESLRLAAEKKAEEDRLRKEQEAATKRINENVRKLMGKKGDD